MLRSGSLFTGIGGLDLAVNKVFDTRTSWASEIDPSASKVIERRLGVPNLGDITSIDWKEVLGKYGRIDVLAGGFPCLARTCRMPETAQG